MNRRAFLAGLGAAASGLLVPEPMRAYSFLPGTLWPESTTGPLEDIERTINQVIADSMGVFGGKIPYTDRGIEMIRKAIEIEFAGSSVRVEPPWATDIYLRTPRIHMVGGGLTASIGRVAIRAKLSV